MSQIVEMYSLEEEDGNELFLTQTERINDQNDGEFVAGDDSDDRMFLGLPATDFQSLCASLTSGDFHYSEISEDEHFDDISLQNSSTRWVLYLYVNEFKHFGKIALEKLP